MKQGPSQPNVISARNGADAGSEPVRRGRISRGLRSAYERWPRIVNIALLVAGLGFGQGTIFLVQTVLLAAGEFELIAAFGTHYSFAMLGIIVVDGGASTILARAVARMPGERSSRDEIWQIFCATSAVRLLTASLIAVVAITYVLGVASDDFSRWYVASALPGLLLWAANAVGILDGLRLSGISGFTGSAAYILTAIGLVFATHRSPHAAGLILGSAFSLGYLVVLAGQWIALRSNGWHPRLRKVTRAGFGRSFRDGSVLMFQLLPGQLNMRVQLVLSTTYLGAETTALFIYAKQVVTAATQIIAFVQRVDFPGLVEQLAGSKSNGFRSVLKAQRATFYCALAFAAAATALAGLAAILPEFRLHRAATVMVLFVPTILTLSLSLMITQALAAQGAYAAVAKALAISSGLGIVVSYMFISTLGVYALALGEIAIHLAGIYLALRYLRHLD